MKGFRFIEKHSSFNPFIIVVSLFTMLVLVGTTVAFPQWTEGALNSVKSFIFQYFSWFYVLICSVFLLFLLFLSLSQMGDIKLGSNEEEPEFSFYSWLAMLFAAGMGVGLMFFGVAEPLSHALNPTLSPAGSSVAIQQREAMLHTIFHWGIHAWTIYGMIALALAYFGFRYKLPLSLRSCFYPLLKEKINGKMGDAINIMALGATFFGLITTLGFGAMQIGAGLQQMGWIDHSDLNTQIIVIAVIMTLAVASAISGVGKGVRILSELNLLLAMALMIFVLFSSETVHLLSAFSDNIGYYLSNIVGLSFKTYTYEPNNHNWFTGWTVLYWAWWFSWSPFVGLFIARISRGRTIREFVFGVLALPSLLCILWFSVFGNSAIWIDEHLANGTLSTLTNSPEKLLFAFLSYLPLPQLSSVVALLVIALFFITSADSGIYVLNHIASTEKNRTCPHWQALMWGALMSGVAIVLLKLGGLATLQTVTLIIALPFAGLMSIMGISLWKALMADHRYFQTELTPTSIFWTGSHWKMRLKQMLNQNQMEDIQQFIHKTVLPAFESLKTELVQHHHLNAQIQQNSDSDVSLHIKNGTVRNFVYGVSAIEREVSKQLIDDNHLPHIQHQTIYEPITYFSDGRKGYGVQYMTQQELIADVLKQYERYLSLADDVGQEILAHEIATPKE